MSLVKSKQVSACVAGDGAGGGVVISIPFFCRGAANVLYTATATWNLYASHIELAPMNTKLRKTPDNFLHL